jgi:beta-N-acetylhexosaminidase
LAPADAALARVPAPAPTAIVTAQETVTPAPGQAKTPRQIMQGMSVADKVGQLFLVTFQGNDASATSDIAALVRDYRVGGVALLPANGNFRNVPVLVPGSPITSTEGLVPTRTLGTPQQIATLANALQLLAMSPAQPITRTAVVTVTSTITPTVAPTVKPKTRATPTAQAAPVAPNPGVPLLIALDWAGDDSSFLAGTGGFTPLPSAMALGATWTPALAEQIGAVMGQELRAAGASLLLGPTLDVLDVPRPGSKGDLDTRTFGGDPFWVGKLGQAFIRGMQTGSDGAVVTAAKHFPGQGGSDRRPEDEVATVQKSMEQLRQIELAPFAAVTAGDAPQTAGATAALMTSHIRYRGFQGNIRQLTPPISLAPQLQDLMGLQEFADWRAGGGVLVSEALGVPALRRYYDPGLTKFPHRQVAQDAFLAGNDLLYLNRFALTDDWPAQMAAITETIQFFQEKYRSDDAFRSRVDASVERILALKQQAYGTDWQPGANQRDVNALPEETGQEVGVTQAVARSGLTLIYPGPDELADRMPSSPLVDESIVIFTDTRTARECDTCAEAPLIAPTAIQDIVLRLYGPNATGQISPKQIQSFTFEDLRRMLAAERGEYTALEDAIAKARWIIFAQLDDNPEEYPASAALRTFLAQRSDSLRDKRLVGLSFSAPYYLDTTEISKLTAYFGVYSHTAPFLEMAVRALFREFSPTGAPPVSVSGINYDLIRQLEPAPGQIIPLGPSAEITGSIKVGSQILLETGVIRDRNGNPVPDGTPVEFHLRYPTESLALAPKTETTVSGKARTTVALDRPGELWITVQAGEAKDSTRIELRVGGDTPGTIATVVPSPTLEPTVTPTLTPEPSPTPLPTPEPLIAPPTAGPAAVPPRPRVAFVAFIFGLAGTLLAGGVAFAIRRRRDITAPPAGSPLVPALSAALWAAVAAWIAYLLYAVGWLPGATLLQAKDYAWAAGMVTFSAGVLTMFWTVGSKMEA